jgi:fucose 4-O-acetylase-like acetyltransferase
MQTINNEMIQSPPENIDKTGAEKNKNFVFAFLYVIGSILIVAGHCVDGGINLAFDLFPIYSFHLGLFMFCSGYFYKSKNENELGKYMWKKIKRLIIPMYIWNIVYGLFVQLTRLDGFTIGGDFTLYNLFIQPLKNGNQFEYNMCFWFIPELFLIQIITCSIRKIINKFANVNEYIFFIFYFLLGILGVYLSNLGLNKEWNLLLVRTLFFFPFFGLGILYNRKLEKVDNLKNIIYFSIILTLQLIIIFVEGKAPYFITAWCEDFTSNLALPYMVGFLGIAFWLRIAKIMEPITMNSKVIDCISNNAYPIMAHQFLGFFILKYIYFILSQVTPLFSTFSVWLFKIEIWYYYYRGPKAFLILYLVFGLTIPILINTILTKIKIIIINMVKMKKASC